MDASDPAALRRLLLSKGFLLRGEELSRTGDPLDSMVAIHHLHLAVEVAARAMLLRYELGGKDAYDPPFSEVLRTLEKNEKVKAAGPLTYLAEVRKLNQRRNLVQHDADPVAPVVLEESRVVVRLFLERLFGEHFGVALGTLDDLEYILDERLRGAIRISRDIRQTQGRTVEDLALAFLGITFQEASRTSWNSRPHPKLFMSGQRSMPDWAESVEDRLILEATGVNLLDFQRFSSLIPPIGFMVDGSFQVRITGRSFPEGYVDWADNFVVSSILRWQRAGFSPQLVDKRMAALSQMEGMLQEAQEKSKGDSPEEPPSKPPTTGT